MCIYVYMDIYVYIYIFIGCQSDLQPLLIYGRSSIDIKMTVFSCKDEAFIEKTRNS